VAAGAVCPVQSQLCRYPQCVYGTFAYHLQIMPADDNALLVLWCCSNKLTSTAANRMQQQNRVWADCRVSNHNLWQVSFS